MRAGSKKARHDGCVHRTHHTGRECTARDAPAVRDKLRSRRLSLFTCASRGRVSLLAAVLLPTKTNMAVASVLARR